MGNHAGSEPKRPGTDPAFGHTTERWACVPLWTQLLPILQRGGHASLSGPSVCPYYRAMGAHRSPDPAFAHTTKRWVCIALRNQLLPILQSDGRASLSGPSVCPFYRAMGVHRSPDPAFAHTTER